MCQSWGLPPASDARAMMAYDARRKRAGIAYVLWFFFRGSFGAHRFSLDRTGSALAMACVTVVSFMLLVVAVGALGLLVVPFRALVDAFLIPGMVRGLNVRVMRSIV